MIRKLPLVALFFQFALFAQEPIFSSSSTISTFGSVNSPLAEQVENVIDENVNTKYLDFSDFDGIAFTVNLNGAQKIATSMEFTTANDSPERDPMNYEILGSNDGSNFTVVTSGSIVCKPERYSTTNYAFSNTTAYSYYRLIFTNQCDTIESIIQIAEVQLYQTALSNEVFLNKGFALYPNPTEGRFSIRSQNMQEIDLITVTDALGKKIKQLDVYGLSNVELNLEGILKGVYFVKIASGSQNVVKKIMIK